MTENWSETIGKIQKAENCGIISKENRGKFKQKKWKIIQKKAIFQRILKNENCRKFKKKENCRKRKKKRKLP